MNRDVQTGTDTGKVSDGISQKHLQAVSFQRSYWKRSFLTTSKIKQKQFINIINFHNFLDEPLYVHMAYPLSDEEFLFRVNPGPCIGDEITCTLPEGTHLSFDNYTFKALVIDNGKSIIVMHADPIDISSRSLTVKFRKSGTVYNTRYAKRFSCQMVDAILQQEQIKIEGSLEEFSPSGLRIALKENLVEISSSIRPSEDLSIELSRGGKRIFSGIGSLIRMEDKNNLFVVRPRNLPQTLYRRRKSRNPRMSFSPSPKIVFDHPFTMSRVTFDVVDITSSGFSVVADSDTSLLMPGMIIDNITIARSGVFNLKVSAQVIYASSEKKKKIKYGFAIYDTDVTTYNQLFDLYSNAIDRHANVSREVNMDLLWEFFFESGFIYPKKYSCFSQHKEDYKKTYEKLYHRSPDIFANFTYQENEKIYGHVSIIKAYERTWMIHHLAAKPMGTKRTGLFVLNHVLNYFDGFYRMPSIGMDYMIFYFRPENKFPNHFFGGFCRQLNNPKGCSMDCFAYLTQGLPSKEETLPVGWLLHECSMEDIRELKASYKKLSGGLTVDSFCLDRKDIPQGSINDLYTKYGLKRRYGAYVLKHEGTAKAYMVVDESDMGINLSELLNSIKVIVTDDKDLPWGILKTSLGKFAQMYNSPIVPVLVYPTQYVENQRVEYDKKYNLWVLSAQASDDYAENLKREAKIRPVRLLLKILIGKFLNK